MSKAEPAEQERDLRKLFYSLNPSPEQERALMRTVWKDGIDLELPNDFFQRLAAALAARRASAPNTDVHQSDAAALEYPPSSEGTVRCTCGVYPHAEGCGSVIGQRGWEAGYARAVADAGWTLDEAGLATNDSSGAVASSQTKPAEPLRVWLRNNMTFYNTADQLVPTLASVSKRIWYHATDDTENYPFDAVADAALKDQSP